MDPVRPAAEVAAEGRLAVGARRHEPQRPPRSGAVVEEAPIASLPWYSNG